MIKTCLLFLLLTLCWMFPELRAQQRPACATMEHLQRLQKEQPALRQQMNQLNKVSEHWIRDESVRKLSSTVVKIPVVVHVVYRTEEENISGTQIRSQIAALNEDFRRLNIDTVHTPADFRAVAADTQVEFCLAVRDAEDNPTDGITRTRTTVTSFSLDDAIKSDSRGGKNAWDPTRYLNIWVGNVDNTFLGYAQFPGGPVQTDGVVIGYRYFGREGTAEAPFNQGRTTTHEIGHWLNLLHIWGNGDCGDDQISDTPPQKGGNYACPAYPMATCGNASDMFMNYMDYTDDACMNLFTQGQRDRIRAALQVGRPGILTSQGCVPVVIPPLDASVYAVTSPLPFFCQPSFTPAVVLKNTGQTLLTSATISYQLNGGSVRTYQWTGNLASFQTIAFPLSEMQVGPGNHTFTASVSRPNNGPDDNSDNDAHTVAFETIRQEPGLPMPLKEGFEKAVFPPANWQIMNPDGRLTWERTTKASRTGLASATVQNFAYSFTGQVDELVLPAVDLTSAVSPQLSFEVAYSLFKAQGFSDTLEILVSTDCGVTFSSCYKKFGPDLVTAAALSTEDDFVPTSSEWRKVTIDLEALASYHSVIFKFRNITDYENNLYLDDILIKGIQEVALFPNPTTGQAELQIPAVISPDVEVLIMDLTGRVITRKGKIDFRGSILVFDLSREPNGLYLVRVRNGGDVTVRKVLLAR